MRVGELIDSSHLRLRLVAGAKGVERVIEWAHVSELEDPTPWLEGSELLMTTGMAIPIHPLQQVAYVERLVRRGVAALAVNADMFAPRLASETLREANASAFPIIEVPVDVPFEHISRLVFSESLLDSGPARLLQILYALRAHLVRGSEVGDLFSALEGIARCRLYGVSVLGQPLHPDLPLPPKRVGIQVPISPDRLPSISEGVAIPMSLGGCFAGYLIATANGSDGDSSFRTVQLVSTIVASEIDQFRNGLRMRSGDGAETLRELLDDSLPEDAARNRLRLVGFPSFDALTMLAFQLQEHVSSDLQDAWHAAGIPFLFLPGEVPLALVPADDGAMEILEVIRTEIHAGASRVVSYPGGVALARHEALWSLRRAVALDRLLVTFSLEDGFADWLPSDPVLLRQVVDRILGPVVEYDTDKGTELLHTLRVWLDHNRSLELAASELSIHKHTLVYRIKRIETLTGRRLSEMSDLVDCWLAIRAREMTVGRNDRAIREKSDTSSKASKSPLVEVPVSEH